MLRVLLAIWAGKLATIALRAVGRAGTHVPGLVARRIHPGIIGAIQHPPLVIAVTGTNGKTTVTNMLTESLLLQGRRVASNRTGSNLAAGIASTLIESVSWTGRSRVDVGVFEMDERSARIVLPGLKPDYLVGMNLTRDSIKRNAHPAYIAWVLSSAIGESTTLVLNADDLVVASLGAEQQRRVFFAVERREGDGTAPGGAAVDVAVCPVCQHRLDWDYWRYNHIGRVRCASCGFRSPAADYRATGVDERGALLLDLAGTAVPVRLINDSIVNVYNQLAVAAVLDLVGVGTPVIASAFDSIEPPTTRFDTDRVGGVQVVRILTKGLVGVAVSRAFDFVSSFSGRKAIVLTVDEWTERENEVENTAWTYDADYEYLADDSIQQIVVGGVRRYDQALRLAIAGVDPARIVTVESEAEVAERVGLDDVDVVFNLHSVHNAIVTGTPVQRRLRERLGERA